MELQKAISIASNLIEILAPHCDIINIAGSCRRQKPEVGDIEIVCLPKVVVGQDLFGGATEAYRPAAWTEVVSGLGVAIKGRSDGKYMQIELPVGINLDLFMPDDFDYWRQYAIRTGSADWTARFIAGGWKNKGWCGSDAGLRLQSECVSKTSETDGKKSWKCVVAKKEQTLPPHWKSEQELFSWLGLKWVEPKYREIQKA